MSIISVLSSSLILNVKGVMDLEEFYILDTVAYFSKKILNKDNKNDEKKINENDENDENETEYQIPDIMSPNL